MRGNANLATVVATLLIGVALTSCASRSAGPATDEIFPPMEESAGPGESATPIRPTETAAPSPAPQPASCPGLREGAALDRARLVRTVDRGLGQWLTGVTVSPVRQGGRFRGWRVDRLYPDDPCYRQVDIRPGDVVVRVNGSTLEKPEQANQIFQSLRSAPRLQIERLREGQSRTVTLEIVD